MRGGNILWRGIRVNGALRRSVGTSPKRKRGTVPRLRFGLVFGWLVLWVFGWYWGERKEKVPLPTSPGVAHHRESPSSGTSLIISMYGYVSIVHRSPFHRGRSPTQRVGCAT